jgi:hypothetical protein
MHKIDVVSSLANAALTSLRRAVLFKNYAIESDHYIFEIALTEVLCFREYQVFNI